MSDNANRSNAAALPRRPYGPGNIPVSIIGFGGVVVMNAEQDHANRTVARAVERGVNYFDVAPTYGDAQQRLGPAVEPFRKNCFLACKTTCRDAAGAAAELKQSLEYLRTDYLDLYQMHGLISVEKDVDVAFANGGAMETFIAARKSGQVRHLGFSAHSQQAAMAAMDRFHFDSVLFPISLSSFFTDFGPKLLERANQDGLTVLAIKAMAKQAWPAECPHRKRFEKCWYEPIWERTQAELALRFTLSQNITTAIAPGQEELFWLAVDIASRFEPLSAAELEQARSLAAGVEPLFKG
jgi:aryl-alcohol dehydrogenase-like predicted oxidoreductase